MKTVKIDRITKTNHLGDVYNLELKSNVNNPKMDDLYWIDADNGLVTHNCFPKDVNALIQLGNELGVNMNTLKGGWKTNLEVRPEQDWKQLKGRAVE